MKCSNPHVHKFCTKDMDCWIDSPEHFNCYCVWAHYNGNKQLTLQEIAKLMGCSLQWIEQIETKAYEKYKRAYKNLTKGD